MSTARVRLGRIVLRRELSAALLAAAGAAAAAALIVAPIVAAGFDAGPSLFDRALARFDLALLYLAGVMAVLRIAAHIEQDERALWLDGFIAAGASRGRYTLGIAIGAFGAAAVLFGAGAIVFAAAAFVSADASELLVRLPRTLAGGLLLLLHWCAWITLVATVLRRALPSFLIGSLIALAPLVLLTLQLQRSGSADVWLLWLVRLMPGLVPASDPWFGVIQGGAGAFMALLAVRAGEFRSGMHA